MRTLWETASCLLVSRRGFIPAFVRKPQFPPMMFPHFRIYIWYMWQNITVQRYTEGQLWYPFQTYSNIHKSLHVLRGRHKTIPLVCLLPFTQYIWHNEIRHIKYFHHNLEYHTLLNLEYIVHKHNGLFMKKGHHMPEEWLWSRLALQYVLLWFVRYGRYRSMGHINNRNG